MANRIHLQGFIDLDDDDNVEIDGSLAAAQVANAFYEIEQSKPSACQENNQEWENEWVDISISIPQVFVQLHISDKKIDLEEAENNQILSSIGELDIYSEWYGYSEYTILGFSVINFSVGNHDLEEILKSHEGKYVHIILDVQ